jgi:hypothetical protein
MVSKIAAALALMTLAGVSSASDSGGCRDILWFTFCPGNGDTVVKAPEIDPASAMAGLTLLAGGLAVLRGRRGRKSEE